MFQKSFIKIIFFGLVVVGCSGCIQRRFIIRSQPEGAAVTIDNIPVGSTPLSARYVYSGTREFKLEKDGYKTIRVQERFSQKWYEKFPLSFISENFAFREIRDERLLDFQMEPKTRVQQDLLLDRANELRGNVERGTVVAPIQ